MARLGLSEVFALCVDLCQKRGHQTVKDQVVEVKIDERWSFKINGCRVEKDLIPPFHLALTYNGFPAGICGFDGGVVAAGEAANERALIRALRKAGATTPDEDEPEPPSAQQGRLPGVE
jgi:hypothetical protein